MTTRSSIRVNPADFDPDRSSHWKARSLIDSTALMTAMMSEPTAPPITKRQKRCQQTKHPLDAPQMIILDQSCRAEQHWPELAGFLADRHQPQCG